MKEIPLLLIHGYPFDHSLWFSVIASLGANARVIAPDLPGFGKAPVSSGEPSLEAMADHLHGILDQNQHEKVVVAGMSLGGYVALAFAEKFPDRLAALGLISSQAAADSPEVRAARYETIKKIRAHGPGAAVDPLLPKLFSDEKGRKPELRQYPIDGANLAGVDGLCWALEAMAKRPDRTEFLQSLTVPVLIAHGSEDKIVACSKARSLAESCRDPIFVELRGVGHASPLEAPDQVAGALIRVLQKVREGADLPPDDEVASAHEPESGGQ